MSAPETCPTCKGCGLGHQAIGTCFDCGGDGLARRSVCMCPDDCNCTAPREWMRPVYCGCKAH